MNPGIEPATRVACSLHNSGSYSECVIEYMKGKGPPTAFLEYNAIQCYIRHCIIENLFHELMIVNRHV